MKKKLKARSISFPIFNSTWLTATLLCFVVVLKVEAAKSIRYPFVGSVIPQQPMTKLLFESIILGLAQLARFPRLAWVNGSLGSLGWQISFNPILPMPM